MQIVLAEVVAKAVHGVRLATVGARWDVEHDKDDPLHRIGKGTSPGPSVRPLAWLFRTERNLHLPSWSAVPAWLHHIPAQAYVNLMGFAIFNNVRCDRGNPEGRESPGHGQRDTCSAGRPGGGNGGEELDCPPCALPPPAAAPA